MLKNKLFIIIAFLIVEFLILSLLKFSYSLPIIFGCILLSTIMVLKWCQISLKRFILLVLIPPISLGILLVFIKLLPEIYNLGFYLNIDFLNKLSELIFTFIGNLLFVILFEIYVMLPSLVLFSTIMLIIEKSFSLSSQLMILIAPIVGSVLVYIELSFTSSKQNMEIFIIVGITASLTIFIDQYLENKNQ